MLKDAKVKGDRRVDVTKQRKFEERHKILVTVFIAILSASAGWLWSAGHKDQQLQEAYTYIKSASDIPRRVQEIEKDLMPREVIETRFAAQAMQTTHVEQDIGDVKETVDRNEGKIALMYEEVRAAAALQVEILTEVKKTHDMEPTPVGNTAHGG